MEQKIVNKLERKLEAAIVEVIVAKTDVKQLPLLPSRKTMHLMAKAAATVYESAAENYFDQNG